MHKRTQTMAGKEAATGLAVAVAAALGVAPQDARALGYYVTLKSVVSYSNSGSSARDISSSTATWHYNEDTGVITQGGGTFNLRFTIAPTSTLFRQSITGLIIGNGAAATAASFSCTEGNFGTGVGASICGNYNFGVNFANESTVAWGPGTAVSRTIGGDDMALGAQQSLAQYNGFNLASWSLTSIVLSNASCSPLEPGNANGCATAGGLNTGYTWTFTGGLPCHFAEEQQAPECYAPAPVITTPIPAAAWLFGSALGVTGWLRRKAAGDRGPALR